MPPPKYDPLLEKRKLLMAHFLYLKLINQTCSLKESTLWVNSKPFKVSSSTKEIMPNPSWSTTEVEKFNQDQQQSLPNNPPAPNRLNVPAFIHTSNNLSQQFLPTIFQVSLLAPPNSNLHYSSYCTVYSFIHSLLHIPSQSNQSQPAHPFVN